MPRSCRAGWVGGQLLRARRPGRSPLLACRPPLSPADAFLVHVPEHTGVQEGAAAQGWGAALWGAVRCACCGVATPAAARPAPETRALALAPLPQSLPFPVVHIPGQTSCLADEQAVRDADSWVTIVAGRPDRRPPTARNWLPTSAARPDALFTLIMRHMLCSDGFAACAANVRMGGTGVEAAQVSAASGQAWRQCAGAGMLGSVFGPWRLAAAWRGPAGSRRGLSG